jgi:hypothetical protein
MWLNGRGIGEQRGQQVQQSQPQNPGGGQILNRNLGNLSQVPGGSRPLGAFSATGAAAAGSAPGYPPFEQGSFTPLVPGATDRRGERGPLTCMGVLRPRLRREHLRCSPGRVGWDACKRGPRDCD